MIWPTYHFLPRDAMLVRYMPWPWRSYRQNGDCFMRPIRIALLSSKMLISTDKLNNLCITDKKTITNRCYFSKQINVS